jgi:hypothetical protein
MEYVEVPAFKDEIFEKAMEDATMLLVGCSEYQYSI